MNTDKLLGLIASTVMPQPHEALAAIQKFVDKLNNKNIEAFETMAFPSVLTYPLYILDIPENIITLKTVYDETLIDQTFNETAHMENDRVGVANQCYVDRSKKLIFSYSLTAESDVVWDDDETGNWYADPVIAGKVIHQDDNSSTWISTGLVLVPGYRYRLSYTIGEIEAPAGSIVNIIIGGNTYTDAAYVYTDGVTKSFVIEFTALTDGQLYLTPSSSFNGFIQDVSVIAQTSPIQCKVTKTGSVTISTADDKYIPAAMHYAVSTLLRLPQYRDEKESLNHYNEFKAEMARVEVNQIDITPSSIASGGF
jgi:hypothetical protein